MSFHWRMSNVSPEQKNAIYASIERGLCSGISSAYLAYERGNSLNASLITGLAVGIFQQASEFALNVYAVKNGGILEPISEHDFELPESLQDSVLGSSVKKDDSFDDKAPEAPPHFFTLPKSDSFFNPSQKIAYSLNTLLRTSALAALIGPRGATASNWKKNIAQQVVLTSFRPIFDRVFYNVFGEKLDKAMGPNLNVCISTAFNATLNPSSSSLSELAKSFLYYANLEGCRKYGLCLEPNTIDPYVHDCLHMLCFDGLSQLKNLI